MATFTPPSATRTAIGPLTTVFTPPQQCSLCTYAGSVAETGAASLSYADLCEFAVGDCVSDPPTCVPGTETWTQSLAGQFFSPGIYCPKGWTMATTVTSGSDRASVAIVTDTLLPGETAAVCCPSGYSFAPADATFDFSRCASFNTLPSFSYFQCFDSSTLTVDHVQTSISVPYTSVSLFYEGVRVLAPPVQINWRSQDLDTAPSNSAGTKTGAGSASTATSNTSPTTSGDATPANSTSSGLSAGASAGIGVGAALAALLLVGGLAALWWRQRRLQRRGQDGAMAELDTDLGPGNRYASKSTHTGHSELESPDARGIVGGHPDPRERSELPASSHYR